MKISYLQNKYDYKNLKTINMIGGIHKYEAMIYNIPKNDGDHSLMAFAYPTEKTKIENDKIPDSNVIKEFNVYNNKSEEKEVVKLETKIDLINSIKIAQIPGIEKLIKYEIHNG